MANITLAQFVFALATVTLFAILLPYPMGQWIMAGLLFAYLMVSGAASQFAGWFQTQMTIINGGLKNA